MSPGKDIACVVLAGGSNRRFPCVKALMNVKGRPLIERTLELCSGFFDEILISTNDPHHFFYLRTPLIGDIYQQKGPLSGIFSCMLNISSKWIFVCACDMPFITAEMIRLLLTQPRHADVIVCKINDRVHPLLGLYNTRVLSKLESALQRDRIQVLEFLKEVDVEFVPETEIKKIDPTLKNFVNINTTEEYEKYIGGQPCLDWVPRN